MKTYKFTSAKRYFKRLAFHSRKMLIKIISYFANPRFSMKLYTRLLKNSGMKITGTPRYIGINVIFDSPNLISLSNRVVISDECHLLTHDYSITTAMIAIGKEIKKDIALVRGISIGENVFIGKKTIIMPNTTVGNNVIIGAGSVVRGKVESDSIYAGNPAKKIGDIKEQYSKWEKYLDTEYVRIDK